MKQTTELMGKYVEKTTYKPYLGYGYSIYDLRSNVIITQDNYKDIIREILNFKLEVPFSKFAEFIINDLK